MKLLNKEYRGVDRSTDVLSFPQQESYKVKNKKALQKNLLLVARHSSLILGDIVINVQRAKRQAVEQGITLNEELERLLIHGLLHLMGYDHEKSRYQKNKMRLKEQELLNALNTLRER